MGYKGKNNTGIQKETMQNILVDAGAVYKNFGKEGEAVVGATNDGNQVTIEGQVRRIELDNVKTHMVGDKVYEFVEAKIVANFAELSADILRMALPGSDVKDCEDYSDKYYVVERTRQILNSDYVENIALIGKINKTSQPIVFVIDNALMTENFDLSTGAGEEAGLSITFTAHATIAQVNNNEQPWRILYPKNTGDLEQYLVMFKEQNELENAEITVYNDSDRTEEAGDDVTTDSGGFATKSLSKGEYYYSANKDGHVEYEGDFEVVDENKVVEFQMNEE